MFKGSSNGMQHAEIIKTHLESLVFVDEGILNGLNLSGDDGEDGDIDSVELVKAAPCSTLTQTRVDFTHSLHEGGREMEMIHVRCTVHVHSKASHAHVM